MRLVATVLVILFIGSIILWARGGDSYHIAQAFPFLGGQRPLIFDVAALVMVLIALAGVLRLLSPRRSQDETDASDESTPDEDEQDRDESEPDDTGTESDQTEEDE